MEKVLSSFEEKLNLLVSTPQEAEREVSSREFAEWLKELALSPEEEDGFYQKLSLKKASQVPNRLVAGDLFDLIEEVLEARKLAVQVDAEVRSAVVNGVREKVTEALVSGVVVSGGGGAGAGEVLDDRSRFVPDSEVDEVFEATYANLGIETVGQRKFAAEFLRGRRGENGGKNTYGDFADLEGVMKGYRADQMEYSMAV